MGVHLGDLMGDGVNIVGRFERVAKPGGVCLSEDAYGPGEIAA
jgi:adenylate cyclase